MLTLATKVLPSSIIGLGYTGFLVIKLRHFFVIINCYVARFELESAGLLRLRGRVIFNKSYCSISSFKCCGRYVMVVVGGRRRGVERRRSIPKVTTTVTNNCDSSQTKTSGILKI